MRTRGWTMLLMMLAGWLNRDHQDVIEYLKEENKILREQISKNALQGETTVRAQVEIWIFASCILTANQYCFSYRRRRVDF